MSEAPVEESQSAPIPHAARPPQPTAPNYTEINYKLVSKALQFVTDRAKPTLVPVLAKLWDAVPAPVIAEINNGTDVDTAVAGSMFPVPAEVVTFLKSLVSLRQSL